MCGIKLRLMWKKLAVSTDATYHTKDIPHSIIVDKFPALPYKPEYLSLLDDIKMGTIKYKDIKLPQTSEAEFYREVLLEGLQLKCEQCNASKNVILPMLSLHHMSDHVRKDILNIVSLYSSCIMRYHSLLVGAMCT